MALPADAAAKSHGRRSIMQTPPDPSRTPPIPNRTITIATMIFRTRRRRAAADPRSGSAAACHTRSIHFAGGQLMYRHRMDFVWFDCGALAKLVMPGRDPGGIIVTMLIGIAGSDARRIPRPRDGAVRSRTSRRFPDVVSRSGDPADALQDDGRAAARCGRRSRADRVRSA